MFGEHVGDDVVWIAQGLELNVLGHGSTLFKAQDDFERVMRDEMMLAVEKGRPLDSIGPAPQRFFEMWAQGSLAFTVTFL